MERAYAILGAYPINGIGVHGPGGKLVFLERRKNVVTRVMNRSNTRVVVSILETSLEIVFQVASERNQAVQVN